MDKITDFEQARLLYIPQLPPALQHGAAVEERCLGATVAAGGEEEIAALFPEIFGLPRVCFDQRAERAEGAPLAVGVVFSGGQAPGGHNVVSGLFDGIKSINGASRLYGFKNGPDGLIANKYIELDAPLVDRYRNTGGFDMLCSSRTKLERQEQFDAVFANAAALALSAIVIIGGDDSNTNACLLAEDFARRGSALRVVGCPKTIDGDLKNEYIETSFGFDTASRVYSNLIGNICRDALSAGKYWHFVKLMGRSASHLTLECALRTHPNVALISEEIRAKNIPLSQIVDELAAVVAARAGEGKNFGVALVPEGLIEFIPEIGVLIDELNDIFAKRGARIDALEDVDRESYITKYLSAKSVYVYQSLPERIRFQLCAERDPHGNAQVSVVETEKLLADMVRERLRAMMREGRYKASFHPAFHFLGYEGRCAAPSNFDANYCYALGYNAAALIAAGRSGYISCIWNMEMPACEWKCGGVPLTAMMDMERRKGEMKPVIRKSLVDLEGAPFKYFAARRQLWTKGEDYLYPGSIQYFGARKLCDDISETLKLEKGALRA
ncbi:MAG: diphosphate--fructose-6-phosphate 1-phosphotransferase [Cloacibacillus sp.]